MTGVLASLPVFFWILLVVCSELMLAIAIAGIYLLHLVCKKRKSPQQVRATRRYDPTFYFNMDRPVYAFGTPEGSSAALSAATNLGWQPDSEMTQHI
ncbi:hypothetical protein EB796_002767 [Bugula neritina]|uniref:Uncharacterized protein n=1 Tax=Bugula neritina TaxID=10212 RepID=A0A7J7KKU5_BUGNE|nr:hypothetical protein EB796_002767 [Bugula neritina]